jgi:hypothetical protein
MLHLSLRRPRHITLLFCLALLGAALPAVAQSTFGSIVGTVKDVSGGTLAGASISLVNDGTGATAKTTSAANGDYSFVSLNPSKYRIVVSASGFETVQFSDLDLQSREIKRVDVSLKVGATSDTVTVTGSSAGVITTDVSNLSETKTGRELTELPVAVYSRSTGSTSPILTLSTEPGVQVDDGSNLVVNGTTPALMSYTIDGISSVSVENSGPINELFPSFNSISEIRISGSNNNAEFSGVADVTTTSKSGTNQLHGGIFENFENTVLSAGNPFTHSTPKLIMNNFGGYLGGPVTVPKVFDGKNKLFFFMSYEGLRLPRAEPLITSVPSDAMRNGDLSAYLSGTPIYQPDGTPIDRANVPISPVSANIMKYFMPHQNIGDPTSFQKNYRVNFPAPITSDQADLRIDYAPTSRQSMFVRGTYKTRDVVTPRTRIAAASVSMQVPQSSARLGSQSRTRALRSRITMQSHRRSSTSFDSASMAASGHPRSTGLVAAVPGRIWNSGHHWAGPGNCNPQRSHHRIHVDRRCESIRAAQQHHPSP